MKNKVCLVTGANAGIGLETARGLAHEGATVVMVCRNQEKGDKAKLDIQNSTGNQNVHLYIADLASQKQIRDLASSFLHEFDRLDVLINNAALYAGLKGARFENLDETQWDRVMQVNVKGTWLASRAVVASMRAGGGGSIINIASLAAVFGLPYGLDYVASKAAVIGMTRGMARELGNDQIRVNAVAPSAVMTEGTEEFFGEKFEKAKAVIASNQLIARNLEPEDLTGTIVYLASDASRFVTGQTHMVDGGSWFL